MYGRKRKTLLHNVHMVDLHDTAIGCRQRLDVKKYRECVRRILTFSTAKYVNIAAPQGWLLQNSHSTISKILYQSFRSSCDSGPRSRGPCSCHFPPAPAIRSTLLDPAILLCSQDISPPTSSSPSHVHHSICLRLINILISYRRSIFFSSTSRTHQQIHQEWQTPPNRQFLSVEGQPALPIMVKPSITAPALQRICATHQDPNDIPHSLNLQYKSS